MKNSSDYDYNHHSTKDSVLASIATVYVFHEAEGSRGDYLTMAVLTQLNIYSLYLNFCDISICPFSLDGV